ncbi:response regulator transcription factor [Amycolatopsis sp. NPDC051071]|uniref:helix-turn-helix transcriptional regulator n=1 Tax=Amycolatopsis sp. NPDC051071 TaxID=3154637 RepID=UPI00343BDA8F
METVRVSVRALDPVTKAGMVTCLEEQAMKVVDGRPPDNPDVVVVVFERLSADAVSMLREAAADLGKPIVVVTDRLQVSELAVAVECRVVAILPRAAVTDIRLSETVRIAAAGGANLPSNLLGKLIEHTERLCREELGPGGLPRAGLSPREVEVLRMMAEGLDTREIATELSYSERTVKNIVYAITDRLGLRNRSHAVAYAMRAGVI